MTVETILLLLLVLMQAVIFIMLWRLLQTRRQQGQELGAEVNSQLESLERRFYENVRDLRSEQNTLAVRPEWKVRQLLTVWESSWIKNWKS